MAYLHVILHFFYLHTPGGNAAVERCKEAYDSFSIIEQNGDGLLEDSHMPVGWPLHIDGARQCCTEENRSVESRKQG